MPTNRKSIDVVLGALITIILMVTLLVFINVHNKNVISGEKIVATQLLKNLAKAQREYQENHYDYAFKLDDMKLGNDTKQVIADHKAWALTMSIPGIISGNTTGFIIKCQTEHWIIRINQLDSLAYTAR